MPRSSVDRVVPCCGLTSYSSVQRQLSLTSRRSRTLPTFRRSKTIALLLALLFVLTIVATQSAQAQNPVPLVNQPLVPTSVAPSGSGFTLTVNGTGFVAGSVVKWNESALSTTFIDSSQLKATVPSADIASAGTALITVVSPQAGGGTSNTVYFQITNPAANPLSFSKTDYTVGTGSGGIAVADFNGDRRLDLAVTNLYDNTVSVLLGKGDGTFQSPASYRVGTGPLAVAVGDFNHDGKLDLVTSNAYSFDVSVLLGNGDGTFQAAMSYPVRNPNGPFVVADLNGDGSLDIAVPTTYSGVGVLLGNGDGSFQPAAYYLAGVYSTVLSVGDFNGDGKLDVGVGNNANGGGGIGVSVLLGNGDGTLRCGPGESAPGQVPGGCALGDGNGPVSPSGNGIVTADLNGDGKPDLAVTANNTAVVLLGNGDGTFQPGYYPAQNGSLAIAVAVGDFKGDGKLDLAVTGIFNNTVSVLLGNGDGTFQAPLSYASGAYPTSVATGDFNGDGRLDLAMADFNANTISILLQVGQQSATTTTSASSANPSTFGQAVTFTATVNSSGGTPSGTVTFLDGSTQLGTTNLTSGQATFSTSSLSIGSHSITASYGGNSSFTGSSASLTQKVGYGICALYDQTKSVHSGAVIPIRLQLCDINGNDMSSSSIVVHATGLTSVSGFSGDVEQAGDSNPDNDFRFDGTLGPSGGYIFNLSTSGLATGTYSMQFTAGSDPVAHSVNFGVK